MSDTYKGFSLRPELITTLEGEVLDPQPVLDALKRDCLTMQALVQWELDTNGHELISKLSEYDSVSSPNTVGRRLGIVISPLVKDSLFSGRSGLSRFQEMFAGETVILLRSWASRLRVVRGDVGPGVFVSRGFKRTARDTKPTAYARMNLGFVNAQYASFVGDGVLRLVVGGDWFLFHFRVPGRYRGGRMSLPVVQLNGVGEVVFHFTEVREYQQCDVSERFVVGVDVGKRAYVTVVVWDSVDECVVAESSLSQRVHSLWNSIRASECQVRALRGAGRLGEARLHREANVRKKRELAVIVGQEVAAVAVEWGNAVVVVEDLSWVVNTMANGRWNRGELVRWVHHYVEQNGSRVVRVSSRDTSQLCYRCGVRGARDWFSRLFVCSREACGAVLDCDVNAGANIAQRGVQPVKKMAVTRRKSKRYRAGRPVRRSPVVHEVLRYPGRDRSKSGPTPKRLKRSGSGVSNSLRPPITVSSVATVVGVGGETRMTPRLEQRRVKKATTRPQAEKPPN